LKQDGSVCAVALEKLELLVTELELWMKARRIALRAGSAVILRSRPLDRFLVTPSRQHLDLGVVRTHP